MKSLIAWLRALFNARGVDWTPVSRPPRHRNLVQVEFSPDWAVNHGRIDGVAYYDPDYLEWSLEGVAFWREVR